MAQAIQNVRDQFPQVGIMHYMDDILLAHTNEVVLLATCGQLQQSIAHAGLVIAQQKVENQPPFRYYSKNLCYILKKLSLRNWKLGKITYKP